MTILNDVYSYRAGLNELSDEEFYSQYPELKELDNGEGWFSLSENRTVDWSEFVEFGRTAYCEGSSECEAEEDAYKKAAAESLTVILKARGDSFARYYIRQLDWEVARYYVNNGGAQFYEIPLSKSFAYRGFESPFRDTKMCDVVNKLEVDAKEQTVNVQMAVEGYSNSSSGEISCTTIDVEFKVGDKDVTALSESGYVNGVRMWTRMTDTDPDSSSIANWVRSYDWTLSCILEAAGLISELGGYDQEALSVFARYEYFDLRRRMY